MRDDVIERLTDALWDDFCPGIRQTPEDRAHYRSGVLTVLRAVRDEADRQATSSEIAWGARQWLDFLTADQPGDWI